MFPHLDICSPSYYLKERKFYPCLPAYSSSVFGMIAISENKINNNQVFPENSKAGV
jgi:hypothetical protein